MIRFAGAGILVIVSLAGCKWLPKRKSVQDAGVDAGVQVVAAPGDAGVDAGAVITVDAKDLPQGHWQATDGSKIALTILPDGLLRFMTEVPSYRNGARVFGQVAQAIAGDNADSFRIWVDVTKILAKEIGPAHRRLADFELFEAEILGQRVTSPNGDAQKIPQLGGKGAEAARGYLLQFDAPRATLQLCTLADAPQCRTLTKAKSPSDLSRVRTNAACKTDDDCTIVTDGEQCDPCLCPSRPSVRTWPRRPKPDDDHEDLSWETATEHLCGTSVSRGDACAACPTLRAVCKNKACVLRGG